MADAGVAIRLTPRGGRDAITGERDGVILARVSAPPVEGKANAALIALVAKTAGVPKSTVRIVHGETARTKTVAADGLSADALRAALLG